MDTETNQLIIILAKQQAMFCYEGDVLYKTYAVSTGKKGLGEQSGSECTPRGWHCVHKIIGLDKEINSVFISRQWTGELYDSDLAAQFPERDWILTRIVQLDGLEPGRNKGGLVDSLQRTIYIHGTNDEAQLGMPASHGCIRMGNSDIIELTGWLQLKTRICIE